MSILTIRSTLVTKLSQYAAAHSPVLTISREGVPFNKPTDNTPFLEAILIPANTNVTTTDGTRQRFMGTFQVNVWVKEILGTGTAETIAEELRVLFAPVPKILLPVSVETPMSVGRSVLDGSGWRVTPCSLMYRLEA